MLHRRTNKCLETPIIHQGFVLFVIQNGYRIYLYCDMLLLSNHCPKLHWSTFITLFLSGFSQFPTVSSSLIHEDIYKSHIKMEVLTKKQAQSQVSQYVSIISLLLINFLGIIHHLFH